MRRVNFEAGAFFLLSVLFAAGCMETTNKASPQKKSFEGLSGGIKQELIYRNQKIAVLAASCLQDQKDGKDWEANKTRWNSEYHTIVTESAKKIMDSVHTLSDAAKTPEAQQSLWTELKKAYE